MSSAYTPLLGLVLPVTGELSGTWGTVWNDSGTSLIDSAVAGTTTLSTDADVTLTTTTGAANTAREAILLFSGARTALRTITAPAASKIYTVINATTGGFGVKVVGAGPTTGVTIAAGESAVIAWNGSDFIKISNTGGAASFTNVAISGTTTLSGLTASTALALDASKNVVSVTNTGTGNNVLSASPTLTGTIGAAAVTLSSDLTLNGGVANGVAYLNGSKVLTTGTALTFDGTNFVVNTGSVTSGNSTFAGSLNAVGGGSGAIISITPNTISGANGVTYNTSFVAGGSGPHIFSIGGSEQMRLTSTGLVIGGTTAAGKLSVNVDASTELITFRSSGGRQIWAHEPGSNARPLTIKAQTLTYADDTATRLTVDSTGNLGLGVTPSAWGGSYKALQFASGAIAGFSTTALDIYGNAYDSGAGAWKYQNSSQGATRYSAFNGQHQWYTAPSGTAGNVITFTQAMTLDASGNLLRGQTSSGVLNNRGFYSDTAGYFGQNHLNGDASGSIFAYFAYNGSVIGSISQSGTTATLYNVTSDQRLKENIVNAPEFGSVIDSVKVRSYDWKSDGSHQRYGFIAQELVTVVPEAVHQPEDPEAMMAVDYSKLVPMLVKEIQSLRKRLAALEAK